jgi:HPt (histidine-containing phosphotransfer) domain-containing protein
MNKQTEAKVDNLIAELWQKHLPNLRERLALIDRTAVEASSGTLAETSRAEALSIAHKLAGNLGMFGYPIGSEVASQIEHILKAPTSENLTRLATLATQLRQALAPGLQAIPEP